MATPKQAHSLTSYFGAKFKEKYGIATTVNRNTARWSWDGMLEDMNELEIKELIDYYLSAPSANGHSLDWFFYNYDKLQNAKVAVDADRMEQASVREATRRRTEEWRKKHGIS